MSGSLVDPRSELEEGDALAAELRELLVRRDRLSLEAARLAGRLSELDYGEAMASLSTPDWIRHECHLGYQAAADLVTVGRQMAALPEAMEAVEEGEIGFQHLVLLARTQQAVGQRPLDGRHLLAEAKGVSVGRFWHLCQHARHAADAQGLAAEQALALEERALRLNRQQDGSVSLSGLLDPLGGTLVKAALEPLARRSGEGDERSRERRLADALVELSQHALDQAPPRQRPHLNVTATVGTLYEIPGSAAAEVEQGPPVCGVTVGRIACDCSITRHVLEPDSVLVELGRTKRVVSPSLRKALQGRDRHCRWPGCTRPASWCEAHHVLPWTRGGPTNLDNLVLMCGRHHMQVHEGRWQLLLHPDGRLEVLRPPLDFAAPPRGPAVAAA